MDGPVQYQTYKSKRQSHVRAASSLDGSASPQLHETTAHSAPNGLQRRPRPVSAVSLPAAADDISDSIHASDLPSESVTVSNSLSDGYHPGINAEPTPISTVGAIAPSAATETVDAAPLETDGAAPDPPGTTGTVADAASPPERLPPPRPASTFRKVSARAPSTPHARSPLGPGLSSHARLASSAGISTPLRVMDVFDGTVGSMPPPELSVATDASIQHETPRLSRPDTSPHLQPTQYAEPPPTPHRTPPPIRRSSPQAPDALLARQSAHSPDPTPKTARTNMRSPRPAPYQPGFQPRGHYRPRTDDFLSARAARRSSGKIEETRLERRLEKLIELHFSAESRPKPLANRRASSFFDLDISELKAKRPADLFRGVLESRAPGGKSDIRASEQSITHWEEDSAASQCRICSTAFHPITNRKHHCRLCGRLVCALPAKSPNRPQTCSILFIADPKTGAIEEVGEGVDYGVRKRKSATGSDRALSKAQDEEKFLKGVRICRECRPTLLRRQYIVEASQFPVYSRLYEALIRQEKDIVDSLPQFQQLLLSLQNSDIQTPDAKAARKRLVEAFADYDALAKQIRALPCASGSSQDRIQLAISMRANNFLQHHMFPLQALPKPKAKATPESTRISMTQIDRDSELALALQPLLEQEKLLELYLEEAKEQRKFEDAKTLQVSLAEIRLEIDRLLETGHLEH